MEAKDHACNQLEIVLPVSELNGVMQIAAAKCMTMDDIINEAIAQYLEKQKH